jgi:hypothetical protein
MLLVVFLPRPNDTTSTLKPLFFKTNVAALIRIVDLSFKKYREFDIVNIESTIMEITSTDNIDFKAFIYYGDLTPPPFFYVYYGQMCNYNVSIR